MSKTPNGLRYAKSPTQDAYTATAPFKVWRGDFLRIEGQSISASTMKLCNAVAINSREAGEIFAWVKFPFEVDAPETGNNIQ